MREGNGIIPSDVSISFVRAKIAARGEDIWIPI